MGEVDPERCGRIEPVAQSIGRCIDKRATAGQCSIRPVMNYELLIGLRYTRSKRRAGSGNRFISFISMMSMFGIALGVAALIVVLSVMNGFQKELRTRILGVASHIQLSGIDDRLANWQQVADGVSKHPQVRAAAPFVNEQGMLAFDSQVRGAVIRGILPEAEDKVADFAKHMKSGRLDALQPGAFGIVLGAELARALRVFTGDKLTLIAPQGLVTPAAIVPRLKQFTVVGIFEVGMFEFDSGLALIHIADAQVLYRMGDNVSGVRLKIDELFAAPRVSRELAAYVPTEVYVIGLDQKPRQLLPRGGDREEHDVHHPLADRGGGRLQHRVDAGDGGARQAGRHRDPAHAGRQSAQRDDDLHHPGAGDRPGRPGAGGDRRRSCSPAISTW